MRPARVLLPVLTASAAMLTFTGAAQAAPTGGAGGPLTDRTFQSFTDPSGVSGQYHLYAANVDWAKQVGLLVYADGSGESGLKNPDSDYLLGGDNGLVNVAKRQNMVLLTPLAPGGDCPGGGGSCWYETSSGITPEQKAAWSAALVKQVEGQYPIETDRVAVGGYSSGAQWAAQTFTPRYGPQVMTDGVVVPISYGSPPRTDAELTPQYKVNVAYAWDVGERDTAAAAAAQAGRDWYASNGVTNTEVTVVPGEDHSRSGQFGVVMEREIRENVPSAAAATATGAVIPAPTGSTVTASATCPPTQTTAAAGTTPGATSPGTPVATVSPESSPTMTEPTVRTGSTTTGTLPSSSTPAPGATTSTAPAAPTATATTTAAAAPCAPPPTCTPIATSTGTAKATSTSTSLADPTTSTSTSTPATPSSSPTAPRGSSPTGTSAGTATADPTTRTSPAPATPGSSPTATAISSVTGSADPSRTTPSTSTSTVTGTPTCTPPAATSSTTTSTAEPSREEVRGLLDRIFAWLFPEDEAPAADSEPAPDAATWTGTATATSTTEPTSTATTTSTTQPTGTASASPTGTGTPPGGQTVDMRVTGYGQPDNSPPGPRIAYPGPAPRHSQAGGVGSYEDPVTVAVAAGSNLTPGTRVHIPQFRKYGVVEDLCANCSGDQLDVFDGSPANADPSQVAACQGQHTGTFTVEIDPPTGRAVDTTPLYARCDSRAAATTNVGSPPSPNTPSTQEEAGGS